LEFHHRNPAEKDEDIARAVQAGWALERLQAEVAKCVVLCANCHRKLHAGRLELLVSRGGAGAAEWPHGAHESAESGGPGGRCPAS
jgi:hypothetical protein